MIENWHPARINASQLYVFSPSEVSALGEKTNVEATAVRRADLLDDEGSWPE